MKRVYIIAEVGSNHNGSLHNALKFLKSLSNIDIDAIKFQHGNPQNIFSYDSFFPNYIKTNNLTYKDLLKNVNSRLLKIEDHIILNTECKKIKKDYLCSVFDLETLIEMDSKINLKKYKIPSGELLSLDILSYISKQKKEVFLSTGMASMEEIKFSLEKLNSIKKKITLLHCVSSYPTKLNEINLNNILTLKSKFKLPVGLSDHTTSEIPAIMSLALGTSVIEKHVTFSKNSKGPDHKSSMTIKEFTKFVEKIRDAEKSLGSFNRYLKKNELNVKKSSRKSIVLNTDKKKGEKIKASDISFKRPGYGISPMNINNVIGKIVKKNVYKNKILKKSTIT